MEAKIFGHTYYHETIRRYVILFGTLFNDIYIKRYDNEGTQTNMLRVPITYGPKDKVLARLNNDPNLDRPFSIILPYITFQVTNIKYAQDRKLTTTGRMPYISSNKNYATYVYNPVPYDLEFQMSIVVKNAEDGSKILEQILPFFTPDWTTTIKIIDDPVIIIDVPLLLNTVQSQDNWEGGLGERRYIVWTLNFTMKGQLFGPIAKSKIIKKAITNIAFNTNVSTDLTTSYNDRRVDEIVTVTPGLTANGTPTSNSAESIDYSLIDWNDDYGYVIDIQLGSYSNT